LEEERGGGWGSVAMEERLQADRWGPSVDSSIEQSVNDGTPGRNGSIGKEKTTVADDNNTQSTTPPRSLPPSEEPFFGIHSSPPFLAS